MPPPKKTVLVHDADNYISIHTSTGFSNAVYGAASPKKSVEEILKIYPPSAISKTYILPGGATYDVLKRTLAAFMGANYPNIKMVEVFSYTATAALDGTDCEYDEGETILYYTDKYAESTEKGISIVLRKVDQLFQIVEHIGNNVHEVLNYYPEIKKVIITPSNSSTAWNMVFVNKIIKICKINFNIQHEYVFNDHCRVKPITGIKILINDGTKIEPLNLFHEPIPLTKTIELTLAPEQHAIFIWVSHAMEPYIQDSSYEVASRPGHMTKLAMYYAKFLNGTELFSCEEADWLNEPKKVLPDFPVNECVSGLGFEAFLKCDCPWCNDPCTVGETRCGKPTKTPNTTTLTPTITSEIPSTTSTPTTAVTTTPNEKKTGLLIIIAYREG